AGQTLCRPATRSSRSLSDPDERALSAPPRDHSGQGFSLLPPEQTRGDSADLPALNPTSPRDARLVVTTNAHESTRIRLIREDLCNLWQRMLQASSSRRGPPTTQRER